MFDSKGLSPETIGELERLLDPGEKLLVAERVRRVTTSRTGFIVITGRSLRLVKRGFTGAVGDQVAEVPISWLRSMKVAESHKKVHLHFSDGSLRSFKITNKRVLPYLQSLRPWIESTHREAIQMMVLTPGAAAVDTPEPDLTMAEAW